MLVSIEKLFSLLVYIILFLISFLIISSNIYIKTLIVLFFLFLIYFFLNKEKITYIGYIFQRVRFLQKKKFLIIFTFIISIFIQLIGIFNQFLIFKLAGVVSIDNYYYVFLIIVITNFISSLPISFAGFGVRDLLILFMGTKLLLIPDYSALLISTIANSLILVTHAICFAVSVSLFIFLKKEKHLNNKIDKQVQKK